MILNKKNARGLTPLKIVLIVAGLAGASAILTLVLNPAKQLSHTRNAQRRADVNVIASAVYQYSIEHDGAPPSNITNISTEICNTNAAHCEEYVKLDEIIPYMTSIPVDPMAAHTPGTGYAIKKSDHSRITVQSLYAENGTLIEVTR